MKTPRLSRPLVTLSLAAPLLLNCVEPLAAQQPFRGGGAFAAASAAQRQKPPLMPWQRTLEDALALVEKTGKPLLICVNMDGEPASERLAWVNYRDPEFVKLARGFIPILASPDQRSPRDYDDKGRRLHDLRFGRLTNYEHITIEPVLLERYFGEQRVVPRHIAVGKGSKILFDIYLTNNFDAVIAALKKHGKPDKVDAKKPADMSEAELLDSPDATHREVLEKRFYGADEPTRVRIAGKAMSNKRRTQHPEILRMAVLDRSQVVRIAAVRNIAEHIQKVTDQLFVPAFRAGADDRDATQRLVNAMRVLANKGRYEADRSRAAQLWRVFTGLYFTKPSLSKDLATKLKQAAAKGAFPVEPPLEADEIPALDEKLNALEKQLKQAPKDGKVLTAVTVATLRYARIRLAQKKDPTFLLQDTLSQGLIVALGQNG